jgi:hypothetical protein
MDATSGRGYLHLVGPPGRGNRTGRAASDVLANERRACGEDKLKVD